MKPMAAKRRNVRVPSLTTVPWLSVNYKKWLLFILSLTVFGSR
jgi:hypothetical protein